MKHAAKLAGFITGVLILWVISVILMFQLGDFLEYILGWNRFDFYEVRFGLNILAGFGWLIFTVIFACAYGDALEKKKKCK